MKRCRVYLFFLFPLFCLAQTTRVDTLRGLLQKASADTTKVIIYNQLCWEFLNKGEYAHAEIYLSEAKKGLKKEYFRTGHAATVFHEGILSMFQGKSSEALAHYKEALEVYKKMGDNDGVASAYNNLGLCYFRSNQYTEALQNYSMSITVSEKTGNRKKTASPLGNMGTIYYYLGETAKSLDMNLRALKIEEENKNEQGVAECLTSIGNIYHYDQKYAKAMECMEQALALYTKLNNRQGIAACLINIGNINYSTLKYVDALVNYKTALSVYEKTGDKKNEMTCLNNIANIFFIQENYREGFEYLDKAMVVCKETGDKEQEVGLLMEKATACSKIKKYNEALILCNKSVALSNELGLISAKMDAERTLSDIYLEMGQGISSLEHFKIATLLKDSLSKSENKDHLQELEVKYETEKKEAENKILFQQNEIQSLQLAQNRYFILALCSLILIISLLALLLIRQSKLRHKQESLQLEHKLLRSQMNPHFIFNSLQAIQNYMLKNNTEEAVRYLNSFATITRSVLENSRFDHIPLKKEISLLENYMQMQKLRFRKRFEYKIHVDPALDPELISLPPMLSQPFIENAIEHGMRDIDDGGMIDVYFTISGEYLLLSVRDNGKGMQANASEKNHSSLATTITEERIKLMNRKKKNKVFFTIKDAFPYNAGRKGVQVDFRIPL